MVTFFLILGGVFFCALLGKTAYSYYNFRESAAYRWSRRVHNRHFELALTLIQLRFQAETVWDSQPLEKTLFQQYLANQPVDLLTSFLGIGPGTVNLLRSNRLHSIADVDGYPFEALKSIGPAKAKTLRNATRKIILESRERFQNGGCEESRRLQEQIQQHRDQEAQKRAQLAPQIAAIETAIREDQDRLKIADRITFISYILGLKTGFTDRLLEEEIPAPEKIIAAIHIPMATLLPPLNPAPPSGVVTQIKSIPPAVPQVSAKRVIDPFANAEPPPIPKVEPTTEPPLLKQLRAYASLGILMARADGRIAAAERMEIRRYLEEQYGHDIQLVRHFDPAIEAAEKETPTELQIFTAIGAHCPTQTEKLRAYNFALRVADASSGRNQRELAMLERLKRFLELKEEAPGAVKPPEPVLARESPARVELASPKPTESANMRENALLDDVFSTSPEQVPPPVSAASSSDIRCNELLDEAFGA